MLFVAVGDVAVSRMPNFESVIARVEDEEQVAQIVYFF